MSAPPLRLYCRFSRPLVEGCPSVFELRLQCIATEPVRNIALWFECVGLKDGVSELASPFCMMPGQELAFELNIEPERAGTPSMAAHVDASTSQGSFSGSGTVRPSGKPGIIILERPETIHSLQVQIGEKAFQGTILTEGGIDFGKIENLNDFLQCHLNTAFEEVALRWEYHPTSDVLESPKMSDDASTQSRPPRCPLLQPWHSIVLALLVILIAAAVLILDSFESKAGPTEGPAASIELDHGHVGASLYVMLPGDIKMPLCFCPAGRFVMGASKTQDKEAMNSVTEVRLTHPFWLAKTEVSQVQWKVIMGTNPSHFRGDLLPVEQIAPSDADEFIQALNKKCPMTGWTWVLPTEAQWEYACRAGSNGDWGLLQGGKEGSLDELGWYARNCVSTMPVGTKTANAWGLCDMHGNVLEWCRDAGWAWPHEHPTKPSVAYDLVLKDGISRRFRGGCFSFEEQMCKASSRFSMTITINDSPGWLWAQGLRPALVPSHTLK